MSSPNSERNTLLLDAVSESEFGSISRLAEHLGVSYNCIYEYICLRRSPIDRWGYVKYDAAGMCDALNMDLGELFPDGYIKQPYKFNDGTHPGKYGPRAKKNEVRKYFPERTVTTDQARTVVDLLDIKALVREGQVQPLAEELIRRLKQEDYEVLTRIAFEGSSVAMIEQTLEIGSKAVRSRYANALRHLNSPISLTLINDLKQIESDSL